MASGVIGSLQNRYSGNTWKLQLGCNSLISNESNHSVQIWKKFISFVRWKCLKNHRIDVMVNVLTEAVAYTRFTEWLAIQNHKILLKTPVTLPYFSEISGQQSFLKFVKFFTTVSKTLTSSRPFTDLSQMIQLIRNIGIIIHYMWCIARFGVICTI